MTENSQPWSHSRIDLESHGVSQPERTLRAQEGAVTWARSTSEFVVLRPLFGSQKALNICISREEGGRATRAGSQGEERKGA